MKKHQSKYTSRTNNSKNSVQESSEDQQINNKEPKIDKKLSDEAYNNNSDEKFEDNPIVDNIKPQKTPDENFTDLTRNLTNPKPNIRIII